MKPCKIEVSITTECAQTIKMIGGDTAEIVILQVIDKCTDNKINLYLKYNEIEALIKMFNYHSILREDPKVNSLV